LKDSNNQIYIGHGYFYDG